MKKSILIFCAVLTTFSLVAFGYINWNSTVTVQEETSCNKTVVFNKEVVSDIIKQGAPDFFYDVNSRYGRTITKVEMDKIRSMADFLPEEQIESIVSFHSVSITILDDNYGTVVSETGESNVFNAAQVKLLRTAPYSTNILIRAEYLERKQTGELEDSYTTPHITIVPEKQAAYVNGKNALIEYLKENSKEQTAIVKEDKLQPGKVHFTVTKDGTISNVKLSATSGYPSIDKTMIGLITSAPGKWKPAANSKGEKVDQELVFSFGIVGC